VRHPLAPLLLSLLLLLSAGCAGKRIHLFRGVDSDLYDVEIEEMPEEHAAAALKDLPAEPAEPEPEPERWLEPTVLTSEGVSGRGAWAPEGDRIVFQSVRAGGMVPNPWEQTFLMDPDGSTQRRITMGLGKTHAPTFVGGVGLRVAYASTHHTGETPPREGQGLDDSRDPAMDLFIQDLSAGTFSALAEGPGFDGEPSFCPDGTLAAYVSEREGLRTVHLTELTDGSTPRRVYPGDEPLHSPRLSPTCDHLLFITQGPDGQMLATMAIDADLPTPLLGPVPRIESADWIPGTETIVFASDLDEPGGALDLYVIGLDGDGLRRLTRSPESESQPRPSPDGAAILYALDEQLVVAPLATDSGAVFDLPGGAIE